MPVRSPDTGRIDDRSRGGWRLGLAALIGALAGATLFPRPAGGRPARRTGDPDLKG